MGSLLSCCCGPRDKSGEKEPLLPRHTQDVEPSQADKTRARVNKAAEILGALSAGKLPTQDQINVFMRVLQTSVLESRNSLGLGFEEDEAKFYGDLSVRGKALLDDVRELCRALVAFGLEKNCK